MLLTIHNLPAATRYAEIKSLLQSKCGLQHVILDNLVSEGGGKKVTVGVAEDADAAFLVRKINGLYWNGMQLYVEDVRQQKTASEQPFRSTNPQPQEHTDLSFRSMNPQQDSGYAKGVPMADNMMTPAVQPMMAAMYYVPDYTNNMQTESYGGFMQTNEGYVQHSETVQSGYMGIGIQNATQISQFGMTQYNESYKELSQSEKRSGWGEDYNEKRDFAAEKPIFGRRSPAKSRDWFNNQQNRRQESPLRGSRDPSWPLGGSDNRGSTQPDFRSSVRPTQPEFRSNIRPEEHSGFIKPTPSSGLLEKPARRDFLFSERANEIGGFSGRQNDRQRKPNESERFSGPSSDYQEPNEFSGRHNGRQGRPNEFSGRPNEFSGRPNEFSGKSNNRQGRPNEFSERQGTPHERKGMPNDRPGTSRPHERAEFDFSEDCPDFEWLNERPTFSKRGGLGKRGGPLDRGGLVNRGGPSERGGLGNRGGPSDRGGLGNRGGRSERGYLVNRGGPSDRGGLGNRGGRSDRGGLGNRGGRSERGGLGNRGGLANPGGRSERGGLGNRGGRSDRGHPRPALPESRKRKFEETSFENRKAERPERLSRPDAWRQHSASSPKQFKEHQDTKKIAPRPFVTSKAKAMTDREMRETAVRYVINDMVAHLKIKSMKLIKRQTFTKLITKRMNGLYLDKTVVTPHQCFEAYRAKYPRTDYRATYDTILGLIAQRYADEAVTAPVMKPKLDKPAAMKPTKEEKKAERSIRQAQNLLAQGKVPSFPMGDKTKVAQFKKEEKDGYIPEVKPPYSAAIEDEINRITDIFKQEFEKADDTLKRACNKVLPAELVGEMQTLLARSISRRVTNSGLKVIRIYGFPKLPKRPVLERFLARYGPQSLRKSQRTKIYTVSVDTYKNYDKLCAMQSAKVEGDITLSFKPFHLMPKLKINHQLLKDIRKKVIADMIDKSDLNLLDKDWPAKEAEIKAKEEIMAKEAQIKAKEGEIKAKESKELLAKRIDADKETANAEQQNDVAEKITTDTQKQNEEAILNDNDTLRENIDLTGKNDESKTEIVESNDYLNEDFHVIDEVNETDSDIEYIDHNNEVVDIDEDNAVGNDVDDNNDPDEMIEDNEDEAADLEIDDEDFDIDDVNVDMEDIDDEDLEDY